MNAAARIIHQNTIFSSQLTEVRFSKNFVLSLLIFAIFITSSLSVIYTSNVYRLKLMKLQSAKVITNQNQLHWGQLLLEEASLQTPARIEEIAKTTLKMSMPNNKNIKFLQIK